MLFPVEGAGVNKVGVVDSDRVEDTKKRYPNVNLVDFVISRYIFQ